MDYYEMVQIVKNTKPNGIIISSHLNQLKDYRALEDPFTSKNDKGHSKEGSIECLSDNRFVLDDKNEVYQSLNPPMKHLYL